MLPRNLWKNVPRVTQSVLTTVDGDRLPTPTASQALMDLPGEIKKVKP